MAWTFSLRTNKYVAAWTDVTDMLEQTSSKLSQTIIEKVIVSVENWVNLKCLNPTGWGDLTAKDLNTLTSVEVNVMILALEASVAICNLQKTQNISDQSEFYGYQETSSGFNNLLRTVFEKNSRIRDLISLIKEVSALQNKAAVSAITAPTEDALKWT